LKGKRPVDIAQRLGHEELVEALTPDLKRRSPPDILEQIQIHFHATIRARAEALVEREALRLPELSVLRELKQPVM
jgi:hypothetical protein